MASKFSEFLEQNKIDGRRLLSSSRLLERLRPEDRKLRNEKKRASGDDNAASEEGEKAASAKPHSGRPVTPRLLAAANSGGWVSGPAKTRLLRAVNRILEQRKKDPVDLRALF